MLIVYAGKKGLCQNTDVLLLGFYIFFFLVTSLHKFETFCGEGEEQSLQTLFAISSHLHQIDCLYLPSGWRTWTCMAVSLSVCLVRLHPLTLNSPDGEVYLPACLTARLPSLMLREFWPQFISSSVWRTLPQLLCRLFRIWESEPLSECQLTDCHSGPDKC